MRTMCRIGLCLTLAVAGVALVTGQEAEPLTRLLTTAGAGGAIGDFDTLYRGKIGAGAQVSYIPANLRWLAAAGSVEVQQSAVRIDSSQTNLQIIRAELGAQFRFPFSRILGAYVQATAGYAGARLEPEPFFARDAASASNFSYRAGAGLELILGSFVVMADVGWDSIPGIYDSVGGRLSLGWQFGGRGTAGTPTRTQQLPINPQPLTGAQASLSFSEIQLEPVFPVLYKFYDDNPIGSVRVTNTGAADLEDVEIVLDMETYIDNPKVSARLPLLQAGESEIVELAALFNREIQEITEGEKVSAVIRTSFSIEGATGTDEETVTVDFFDRNAIRWDDDNKVAAFVTTRDAELQPFARNLAAIARQSRRDAVSRNFQTAVMMFLGMVNQGLAYVVDPSSSYEQLSSNPLEVDSVQFPRQTLNYRGGDCDDLSVAYAALLESVGVATAFLTYPGHIYVAFQLDMTPSVAESTFAKPEDLIFRPDNTVWVPVEITLLESGFVEAWSTGAQQWREYDGAGLAGFYRTSEAWNTYLPVAYSGDETIRTVDEIRIANEFGSEMTSFVRREIADRELTFKARLQRAPDNARLHNRLGVLYASYGLREEARASFEEAVAIEPYSRALANLGNLAFLEADFQTAGDFYGRALAEDPRDESALLGLARVNHELENFGTVRNLYDDLKAANPELALQYSYLELRGEEAARASDAAELGESVFWGFDEEDL